MVKKNIDEGATTSREKFAEEFGKPVEEYDSIKRATEMLRDTTRKNYFRVLPRYFLFLGENPDQVIENRRKSIGSDNCEESEHYERMTITYANLLLERGCSGRGVQGIVGRIQGFFSNNSRRYSLDMRRLKLSKARKIHKYSPTNEEIRHLYRFADSTRDKLILALMYQNGLAPADVAALRVGDLPTMEWSYYEKSQSKTGGIWRGVVTPDIVCELGTYLTIRGNPAKDELLFVGSRGALNNQAISGIVSEVIGKSGLNGNSGFKPSSLRDAFEDALVEANVHQKIKEALMGNCSGIEHEYGGQNKLIINITEAMKKAYPFLALNGLAREMMTVNRELQVRVDRIEALLSNVVQQLKGLLETKS